MIFKYLWKVDGQSGSSSDMALLQAVWIYIHKILLITLIFLKKNLTLFICSSSAGGLDRCDASRWGGKLHLWGARQESQVWDHSHQVGVLVSDSFGIFEHRKTIFHSRESYFNVSSPQPTHAWKDARHYEGQSWGDVVVHLFEASWSLSWTMDKKI